MFTSFYTFIENTELVFRTQDAVFLCGAALPNGDDADHTIPNYLRAPQLTDEAATTKSTSIYNIGQALQLTRDGHCKNVVWDSVDVDMDTMVYYCGVRLSNGLTTSVTKEYLNHVGVDRLSYIPITFEKIKKQAQNIYPEILQSLLKGKPTTPLLKEFISLHERLGHMPFVVMYRLCSTNSLPSIFLVLQEQSNLCPSYMFAQAKHKPWRHVNRQAGTIGREHHKKPGNSTMCDQTMSAQKGLVPHMDGYHTRDRIIAVSVYLDSVSGHSFSHL